LDKVEKKKGQFWKDLGIFDLIKLSWQGPKYHNDTLIAALHFWNPSTSSLHLKCGMFTPTLLDVADLTGLKPLAIFLIHLTLVRKSLLISQDLLMAIS